MHLRLINAAVSALAGTAYARAIGDTGGDQGANVEARQGAEPCAEVARAPPGPGGYPRMAPSVALACLHSVPVDVERDIAWIDYIAPMVSFQSNLAFVKNPPEDYQATAGRGGLDILGQLEAMKKKITDGEYSSQYELTMAVETLIRGANDAHFCLYPALNHVFQFVQPLALISLSEDGVKLPEIYELGDFTLANEQDYEPSPVVNFNGQPVAEYLTELAINTGILHDLDAGWNSLLPSRIRASTGQDLGYGLQGPYHLDIPDEVVLELANGTKITVENYAEAVGSLSEITSGRGLQAAAEIPDPGVSPLSSDGAKPMFGPFEGKKIEARQFTGSCPATDNIPPRPADYPEPVEEHGDHYAGLFFLGGDHSDTAVLQIASFATLNVEIMMGGGGCQSYDFTEFHRFITSAVTMFRAEGKKRLIIDLSANGGGYEITLADAFDQLWPGKVPGFTFRTRSTPEMNWMVNGTATYVKEQEARTGQEVGLRMALFNDLIRGYPDVMGPEEINGDDFTLGVHKDTLGERISVGLDETAFQDALLDAEDVVVVTDGDCHSSCAILVGWLTREMGVRSVAIGGRPVEGPMQTMGGTKGGAVYPWGEYQDVVDGLIYNYGPPPAGSDLELPSLAASPINMFNMRLNSMDIWHEEADVPVQFAVEAANCRLFYTAETFLNVEKLWEAVADVAWKGGKCVAGSTVNEDGTMGDKTPAFVQGKLGEASDEEGAEKARKRGVLGRRSVEQRAVAAQALKTLGEEVRRRGKMRVEGVGAVDVDWFWRRSNAPLRNKLLS